MPAAAAARSFARTASQRIPVRFRRRLATTRQAPTSTTRTVNPNAGRKLAPPVASTRTSMPRIVGGGADEPAAPPENGGLASTSCSIATAIASVAMARLMPRTLVAG
jgi:hypothetical protein